jgi:hypothetical protein
VGGRRKVFPNIIWRQIMRGCARHLKNCQATSEGVHAQPWLQLQNGDIAGLGTQYGRGGGGEGQSSSLIEVAAWDFNRPVH